MAAPPPIHLEAAEWHTELKSRWTELAQRAGLELLPEPQVNAVVSRLCKVTSHVASDLSTIVFLGLKIKMQTAAELVLDFVVQSPAAPLPKKLDILQLLERFVDKQFDAYLRDKSIVVSSDDQDSILGAHRKAFEDSHMQAALLSRLCENDFNDLRPVPLFGENNMDRFHNIESGEEKAYFVESMVEGKPRFVDGVFSNYFAAKWFSGHFERNRTFLANKLHSVRRTVMRYLFDRILTRGCDLHVAVLHDDVAGVRRLLEDQGVDASQRDLAGRIALHLAAVRKTSRKRLEANKIMDELLEYTIDIDVKDDLFLASPLLYADMSNALPAIDKLLRRGADTRYLIRTPATLTSAAMLEAIFEHDLDSLMAFCLDKGLLEDIEVHMEYLLEQACEYGSLRVSTLLVARGADINGVEGDDYSPLSYAAASRNLDIVSFLVQKAKLASNLEESQQALAFINDNSCEATALHLACNEGHLDVVAYLLEEGADVWVRDKWRKTPLFDAILGCPTVLKAILAAVDPSKLSEYVNSADIRGYTVLHYVAMYGGTDQAHTLVEAGANVMARDNKRWTPLIEAAMTGKLTMVRYLIDTVDVQLKVDYVNARDVEGRTALHWAALRGNQEVMTLLIDQGASVAILDNDGKTPLDYASSV